MDASKLVLDTLKKTGTPIKGGEIAEKTGLEKNDVDKAIKKLMSDNLIESPKRCFYSAK
ncbi:MAG TPA: MarR family transcriptional regulator [Bacteroidales bacterium]